MSKLERSRGVDHFVSDTEQLSRASFPRVDNSSRHNHSLKISVNHPDQPSHKSDHTADIPMCQINVLVVQANNLGAISDIYTSSIDVYAHRHILTRSNVAISRIILFVSLISYRMSLMVMKVLGKAVTECHVMTMTQNGIDSHERR